MKTKKIKRLVFISSCLALLFLIFPFPHHIQRVYEGMWFGNETQEEGWRRETKAFLDYWRLDSILFGHYVKGTLEIREPEEGTVKRFTIDNNEYRFASNAETYYSIQFYQLDPASKSPVARLTGYADEFVEHMAVSYLDMKTEEKCRIWLGIDGMARRDLMPKLSAFLSGL